MHSIIESYRRKSPAISEGAALIVGTTTLAVQLSNMFANRNLRLKHSDEYSTSARILNIVGGTISLAALVQRVEKARGRQRNPRLARKSRAKTAEEHLVRAVTAATAIGVQVRLLSSGSSQNLSLIGKIPAVITLVTSSHILASSAIELWIQRESLVNIAQKP